MITVCVRSVWCAPHWEHADRDHHDSPGTTAGRPP